jgi:hypothetical protein
MKRRFCRRSTNSHLQAPHSKTAKLVGTKDEKGEKLLGCVKFIAKHFYSQGQRRRRKKTQKMPF